MKRFEGLLQASDAISKTKEMHIRMMKRMEKWKIEINKLRKCLQVKE